MVSILAGISVWLVFLYLEEPEELTPGNWQLHHRSRAASIGGLIASFQAIIGSLAPQWIRDQGQGVQLRG